MLIGLHGKKQAGKDTVHQRMEALLGDGTEAGATVERVSFADKLYESAAAAIGVSVDQLRAWKEDTRYRLALVFGAPGRVVDELTFREYLQLYGTEAHRNVFGPEFWTEIVDLRDHDRKIVVVTDVRFRNEAQAVVDAGGSIVHVIGPPEVESAGDGHASEETLPAFLIDHVLLNDRRDDNFAALDRDVLDLFLYLHRNGA